MKVRDYCVNQNGQTLLLCAVPVAALTLFILPLGKKESKHIKTSELGKSWSGVTFMCVWLLRCCGPASHPVKGGSILQRCFLPLGYLFVPVCFWFGAAEQCLPRDMSAFSADGAQIRPTCLLPLVPGCWAGLHRLQVCLRGRFYIRQPCVKVHPEMFLL